MPFLQFFGLACPALQAPVSLFLKTSNQFSCFITILVSLATSTTSNTYTPKTKYKARAKLNAISS